MRLSIKAKQVIGVVTIVGLAVTVLSAFYVSSVVRVNLAESQARGKLVANIIFHRARAIAGPDLQAAIRSDEPLRSLLESSAVYSPNVTYAAIADRNGVAIAHSDNQRVGEELPPYGSLADLLNRGPLGQLLSVYSESGKTLEVREPLLQGEREFGSIRIGVSTLLIRDELNRLLSPVLFTIVGAMLASTFVATLLAQLMLRPIEIIRHRLIKLAQNDFGEDEALPRDEFGELGESLAAVSARLLAERSQRPAPKSSPDAPPEWPEDAVAVFNRSGVLTLANLPMRALWPDNPVGKSVATLLPAAHPYRRIVEESVADRHSREGQVVPVPRSHSPDADGGGALGEQMVRTDVTDDGAVMLVARDVEHVREVESTLNYARRVARLGRLSAGLAHEIKNPLHATMIQLELLKQLADDEPGERTPLLEHIVVIGAQMRRLDEVVQGFLKFVRPEELKLQRVSLASILDGIMPVVEAEARSHGIKVILGVPRDLPDLNADPPVLEQALLNLALNACEATLSGGTLRIAAAARGRFVEVDVEDTGIGIPPENIDRIFDLYFTTKERGSGIGLSMVFRAVHLHNGQIEVRSTPGSGTTFKLLLPQA